MNRNRKPGAIVRAGLWVAAAVLVLAVLFNLRFAWAEAGAPAAGHHSAVIERIKSFRPAGWIAEELPLGETELVRQQVLKTLNYDEVAYLRFRRGEREFSVYVAYWNANKATARDVRLHTPDTCWVQAGWEETARNNAFVIATGSSSTCDGQLRDYRHGDQKQQVVFWHFMNHELVPHWRYGQPTVTQVVRALMGDPAAVRGEQYFVRVSGPDDLSWLWQDGTGRELLGLLAAAGLTASR